MFKSSVTRSKPSQVLLSASGVIQKQRRTLHIQSARVTFIRGGSTAPHAYVRAQTLQTVFEARACPSDCSSLWMQKGGAFPTELHYPVGFVQEAVHMHAQLLLA
jgi:hypothetical protein